MKPAHSHQNHLIKRCQLSTKKKQLKTKKATTKQPNKIHSNQQNAQPNKSHQKNKSAFGKKKKKSTKKSQNPKSRPEVVTPKANTSNQSQVTEVRANSQSQHIQHSTKSSDRHFVGEGAAADTEGNDGADGVAKVDRKTALAHLAMAEVHRALAEVLLHHKVALLK